MQLFKCLFDAADVSLGVQNSANLQNMGCVCIGSRTSAWQVHCPKWPGGVEWGGEDKLRRWSCLDS